MPPVGVAGDQPSATRGTGNFTGPNSSKRVWPSLQVTGRVYFSVCTSTPSARKAATAHSTALAISGDPVTRPPTSSVRRRRFSSSGDGPITRGRILAAASAQDASVAEQAGVAWAEPDLARGPICAGGSCAAAVEVTEKASNANASKPERMILNLRVPTPAKVGDEL